MTDRGKAARATVLSLLMLTSVVAIGFAGAGAGAVPGSVTERSDSHALGGGDAVATGTSPDVESVSELEGNGTESDPYVITNASGLQAAGSDLDANYTLGNDIDASNTSEWNDGAGFEPIGNASTGFSGSFDGAGYTVSGLTISRSSAFDVGLFGAVDNDGTIENVHLREATVTGQRRTGLLAGGVDGFVNSSSARGNVTGGTFVGGVAGDVNSGELENVSATATVEGDDAVGGLAGGVRGSGVVKRSTAQSTVNGGSGVGGFVGTMSIRVATVADSTAESTVTGTTDVGGFAGRIEASAIERSTASGSVEGSDRVGGFVGTVAQDQNGDDGEIRNAATTVDVEARDDTESVGGFAGVVRNSSVATSYAAGQITGSATDPGGLVGNGTGATVTGSYWDIDTTGASDSNGGVGLNTSAMTGGAAEGNMTGLDFDTVWRTTESYPQLRQAETVGISGSISATSNSSLEGDVVGAFYQSDEDIVGADTEIEDGAFEIGGLDEEQSYNLVYGDTDAGEERNGVPDLYAIERVTPPEEVGTVSIPEAHNVSVRVVDSDANPIEGADVAIEHTNGDAVVEEGERNATNEEGYFTDDNESPLELVDNITVSAEYRGVSNTTTVTVDSDREVAVTLTRPEVTGTLNPESGASVENDSVILYRETADGGIERYNDTVDAEGKFSVAAGSADDTYNLAYGDADAGEERNGVPDLYAIERVTPPEEVGTVSIPEAYNVSVRVTDRDGDPIEGAGVAIGHTNGDAVIADGERNTTNETGYFTPGNESSVELVGNITVGAQYRGVNNTTTVTVDSDQEVAVTLTRPEVTGTLNPESGASVENDSVSLYRETEDGDFERYNDTVDAGGNFTVTAGSADDTYNLVYSDADAGEERNGVPDLYAIDRVTPPEEVGEIPIPEAHNVSVRVTDRDGNPVEGATVGVQHENNGSVVFDGVENATNENGYAAVDGNTTVELVGNLTVGAEFNGFGNVTNVTVEDDREIVVELPLTAEISGQLNRPDGSNASDDLVAFETVESDESTETVTDGAGSFGATVPNKAVYGVYYAQSGSASSEPTFPIDGVPDLYPVDREYVSGDTQLGERTLPEGHRLNVTVETPDGEPLSNVTVDLANEANDARIDDEFETTEDGRIAPGGTAGVELAGFVTVELQSDEYVAGERSVEVTEDGSVTLVARESVTVTGNITTAAGEAATGWQVVGDSDDELTADDDARLDRNGSYALTLARNATYGIGIRQVDEESGTVYPKDGVPDVAAVRSVETGTNDTDVGTSQLGVGHPYNLTVTGPEGEPINDTRVDVVSVNPAADIGVGTGGTTNANGRLVLDGAQTPGFEANGTVDVYVDAPDDSGLSNAFESYEIGAAGSDTIALEPAQQVTGTVIEPDGETPAASERISVRGRSDGVAEDVFTDDSGNFTATVPENGTYSVGFTQVAGQEQYEPTFPQDGVPDVYALANVSSPGDAELGVRTLPRAHTLTVEVTGPDDQPVTDADVNIGSIANDATHYARDPVDGDGNFSVEVNGTVNVYVEPDSDDLEPNGTGYTEVTENETVSVTLTAADSGGGTGDDGDTGGGDTGGDGQAVFNVSELDPRNVSVTAGDPVTVSAVIANEGDAGAKQNVAFRVAGDVVADQNVTLDAGNETTVEFNGVDTAGLDEGAYEHGVFIEDANQTGTLTIEPADDADSGDGSNGGTDDSTPGFGPVVALVAVLSAAALLRRREGH